MAQDTMVVIPQNKAVDVPFVSNDDSPLGAPTVTQSPPASGQGGFNTTWIPDAGGESGILSITNQGPNNAQYGADITVTFPGRAGVAFTARCNPAASASMGAPVTH